MWKDEDHPAHNSSFVYLIEKHTTLPHDLRSCPQCDAQMIRKRANEIREPRAPPTFATVHGEHQLHVPVSVVRNSRPPTRSQVSAAHVKTLAFTREKSNSGMNPPSPMATGERSVGCSAPNGPNHRLGPYLPVFGHTRSRNSKPSSCLRSAANGSVQRSYRREPGPPTCADTLMTFM